MQAPEASPCPFSSSSRVNGAQRPLGESKQRNQDLWPTGALRPQATTLQGTAGSHTTQHMPQLDAFALVPLCFSLGCIVWSAESAGPPPHTPLPVQHRCANKPTREEGGGGMMGGTWERGPIEEQPGGVAASAAPTALTQPLLGGGDEGEGWQWGHCDSAIWNGRNSSRWPYLPWERAHR